MAEGTRAEGSRLRGCFKWGCLGCAGLFALFIVVTAGLTAVALLQDQSVQIEERELAQEIPRLPGVPTTTAAEDIGDPMSDIVQGFQLDGFDVPEPGRVIIDLSMGEFEIVPGPADEPAHIEAVFDTKRYELEQTYETWGENGWTYKVWFGSKSFLKMLGIHDEGMPRIRVVLPRDRPFVLEARMSKGESRTDLGGLWVLGAEFDLGMGGHTVEFSEPLAAPMKGLTIDGSMGEVRVRRAGNASPESIDASHSMGALSLDLRGHWVRDATIEVSCSMGEVVVRVPDDVNLNLRRASAPLGDVNTASLRNRPEAPDGAPTLTLDATGSMGGVRIGR